MNSNVELIDDFIVSGITDLKQIIDEYFNEDDEIKKACQAYYTFFDSINDVTTKDILKKRETIGILLTKKDKTNYIVEGKTTFDDIKNIVLDKNDILNGLYYKGVISNIESYSGKTLKQNPTFDKFIKELSEGTLGDATEKKIDGLKGQLQSLKLIPNLLNNNNKTQKDLTKKQIQDIEDLEEVDTPSVSRKEFNQR
jgi:hypothetical protein